MVQDGSHQADTYLRSGSNELKVLEYTVRGETYGINILKVNRVLAEMEAFCEMPDLHPAVRGVFNDHDRVIPVLDLGLFLGGDTLDIKAGKYRVIVTEFFGRLNAFLVDNVETVHTVQWEQVKDAHGVMSVGECPYVISIVQPSEEYMILLLDYETIILELTPEEVEKEVSAGGNVQMNGAGKKILLAEDSVSVLNMLKLELEERGFEVVIARDGVEALERVGEHPDVALVITDVEMPRMDGLAFTKQLKDTQATANIPIIVYSSIGDVGMKERAKFLKAEEHITKLNLDELFEKMAKLFG